MAVLWYRIQTLLGAYCNATKTIFAIGSQELVGINLKPNYMSPPCFLYCQVIPHSPSPTVIFQVT